MQYTPFQRCVCFGLAACFLPILLAADWPQWRGPERNGVSKETGLLKTWPKGGPKLVWQSKDLGLGFSSFAVVGERLYTMGAFNEETYVLALDAATGKEIWRTKVGPIFTFTGNVWGDGPRCTPTVDGDLIYALEGTGELVCVAAKDGKEVWRRNYVKDLGGEMMSEWGYSESVLIDGDKLICMPGGAKGTLAALNKKTGEVLWRSKEITDKASYASIMAADFGGVRQYIAQTYVNDIEGSSLVSVAAQDGKKLWYQKIAKGHHYAVAPTPIVQGNQLYVSCGDSNGVSKLIEVTKDDSGFTIKDSYPIKVAKALKNAHGNFVLVDGHCYGHSGKKSWVCQELQTGKIVWDEKNELECGSGCLIAAEGRLYLYGDEGDVVLLEASSKAWTEHGRFSLPMKSAFPQSRKTSRSSKAWNHPVIANGRLYVRDCEVMFCYDVRK